MKKIQEILTHNWLLKLGAFVVALFMWIIIIGRTDPMMKADLNVPIQYENLNALDAASLAIVSKPDTVKLTLSGVTSAVLRTVPSDFRATVDLKNRLGTNPLHPTLLVEVTKVGGPSLEWNYKYYRSMIEIDLEEIVSRSMPVKVHTSGELTEEFRLSADSLKADPASVLVRGPKSKLSSVQSVGVDVNLNEVHEDTTQKTYAVELLDGNGNPVRNLSGITIKPQAVSLNFSLLKIKTVPLVLEGTQGQVLAGYRIGGIKPSLDKITLVGSKADLSSITAITIPKSALNVEGMDKDLRLAINLAPYLPPRVSIYGEDKSVSVDIHIEQLVTRTIAFNTSRIQLTGQDPNLVYTFDPKTIYITVKGFREDIDKLTEADLTAEVSVANLKVGRQKINISFKENPAYTIGQTNLVFLKIDKYEEPVTTAPEETTPAESSSEGTTVPGGEGTTPSEQTEPATSPAATEPSP